MSQKRTIFFVSDGTGITAETLGNTILTQFEGIEFDTQTLPFVNTVDRARVATDYINHLAGSTSGRPIVFSTTVSDEIRNLLRDSESLFIDLFDVMSPMIERELGRKSSHTQGRAHGVADMHRYESRIEAMNFAMEHDDGATVREIERAELILIAPSRCGKTPTTLYLALQYGIFATNFPLTEEELAVPRLPKALRGQESKLFGLTSMPERLSQVRGERRPGSRYASLAQCSFELRQAEELYRKLGVPSVNSANMSIEEMASFVIQEKGLRRR